MAYLAQVNSMLNARFRILATLMLISMSGSGCSHFGNSVEVRESMEASAVQESEQASKLVREFASSMVESPSNLNLDAMSQAGSLLGKADKARGRRIIDTLSVRYEIASFLFEHNTRPQHGELDKYITAEQSLLPPEKIKGKLDQEHYENALSVFLIHQGDSQQVLNAFKSLEENYRRENP